MDKEKEIALLADILCEQCSRTDLVGTHSKCLPNAKCHTWNIAEKVINEGYRKMEEVTLKLDLGDRTPEEIKRITEQLSAAMSTTPAVVSLTDNEIRKQAVKRFAEWVKEMIYTYDAISNDVANCVCEDIDELVKEKYGK